MAGEQAAQVLQSHFDRKGDDTRLTGGITMETQSKRWHSVKTVNVSFESHPISSGASLRRPATGREASKGKTPAEDFLFDIKADLSGEEEIYLSN